MFRVECSSCKAPYQVDERRVPKKGLTMKCPKCQASFLVSPPDAPEPAVAPVATSLPKADLRGTMIGVSAQSRTNPSHGADAVPSPGSVGSSGKVGSPGNVGSPVAAQPFAFPSEQRVGFTGRRSP